MNYKDHCRTCLGTNKEMRNIKTVITIAGRDVSLTNILQTFYNFEVTPEDPFPNIICINCVHQLTITYSFKILIDKSSKILEESLTQLDSNGDEYESDFESDDQTALNDIYSRDCKNQLNFVRSDCDVAYKIKEVFCVDCKEKFNSIESLTEHCTNNHELKSTTGQDCDYCNEKFEDFSLLIRHMKFHLKPYICENCREGFYSATDLNSHWCNSKRRNKNTAKVLQQCEQCGKSYPSGYIKIHIRTHGKDTPYSCKYCPMKFKVPCSLNSHVLWKHKKTRNHTCHTCNASFVSASARSSHIRKEHLNERKHICATCGKKFFQKSDMERHYLSHTGVKNFHCALCNKSYQTRYGLNVHLKSHGHVQFTHKIDKVSSAV